MCSSDLITDDGYEIKSNTVSIDLVDCDHSQVVDPTAVSYTHLSMARSLGGSIILNGGTVNATGTVKTNSLEIHNWSRFSSSSMAGPPF